MKKIISLMLSAAILSAGSSFAFAETDKMQEVLKSVKERIGTTDEYESFNSETYEDSERGTFYQFSWSNTEGDNRKSMNVTASESGFITEYNVWDSNDESRYSDKANLNGITVDNAAEKTASLIDVLNPNMGDKIKVISENTVESLYENGFSFELKRYENGIPVLGNTGYVRVDRNADKITNYSMEYNEKLTFPSHDAIISPENAQKAYGEKIGLKMIYAASYDYDKKTRTIIPIYVPENNDTYINALTGEPVKYVYKDYINGGGGADRNAFNSMKQESAADAGFTKAEQAEIEKLDGLLSKEELINIVKANKYLGCNDKMKLSWYRAQKEYFDEKYFASMTFRSDEEYKYLNVNVDMKTGEIISFYRDTDEVYENPDKSADELKALAETAAKELAGDKFSEYKLEETNKDNKAYYTYVRYVNGIPYNNDTVTLRLSEKTGEVQNYRISYTEAQFPKLDGVISKADGCGKLFAAIPYSTVYSRMNMNNNEASLIYVLDDNISVRIDAFTGKILNYNNEEYKKDVFKGYTDISGHYAEKIMNELARFGIRFEGEEARPDEPIMQKDYIALLNSVFVSKNPVIICKANNYAGEYRDAYNRGILLPDEADEQGEVTRALAAKYLIRAMGIDKYASIKGIYVSPFNDVTEYVGHIAILNGLGIVSGDGNGNFNPNGILKRADAMILIYNYLTK